MIRLTNACLIGMLASSVVAGDLPPCPAYPKVKPLDYRVRRRMPDGTGGRTTELREWLVRPERGPDAGVYHVEEEYAEGPQGKRVLRASRQYVANQIIVTLDGETSIDKFNVELAKVGAKAHRILMVLDKNAKLVSIRSAKCDFDAAQRLISFATGLPCCSDANFDQVSGAATAAPGISCQMECQ